MLFFAFCFIIRRNISQLYSKRSYKVRIISGSARGLKLLTPDGINTRPTADRVKEALFSSLADKISSSLVLDAFSGSGALGIEALSRGARRAVMTESDPKAFSLCRENLKKARLADRGEVILTDALSYIDKTSEFFDIIFLDPPYASGLYEPFLKKAEKHLAPGGIIIVEYEEKNLPVIPGFYSVTKEKKYGRVHLSYLTGVEQH